MAACQFRLLVIAANDRWLPTSIRLRATGYHSIEAVLGLSSVGRLVRQSLRILRNLPSRWGAHGLQPTPASRFIAFIALKFR